jgi:outer membrane lipoprotein carrier protein
MMRIALRFVRVLLPALLAILVLPGGRLRGEGTESAVSQAVHKLEARYRGARAFRALFLERRMEGKRSMQVESGTLYLHKPGMMRWEYEAPEKKLFLVDGKFAWFYVPADRTVTKAPVRESGEEEIPLLLLAGKVKLGRVCRRIEWADVHVEAAGNIALRCLPPQSAAEQYREAVLEMDAEGHLVRLAVREPGDVQTEFEFAKWQDNPVLPPKLFVFAPPQGTTIVDERTLLADPERQ